jgi:hypothetical protein
MSMTAMSACLPGVRLPIPSSRFQTRAPSRVARKQIGASAADSVEAGPRDDSACQARPIPGNVPNCISMSEEKEIDSVPLLPAIRSNSSSVSMLPWSGSAPPAHAPLAIP